MSINFILVFLCILTVVYIFLFLYINQYISLHECPIFILFLLFIFLNIPPTIVAYVFIDICKDTYIHKILLFIFIFIIVFLYILILYYITIPKKTNVK